MPKLAKKIFLPVFLILCLAPQLVLSAGTKKMGDVCTGNSECESGDCEESTKVVNGVTQNHCDCGESTDIGIGKFSISVNSESCAKQWGGNAADWQCVDGAYATYNLDYCHNRKTNEAKLPIEPRAYGDSIMGQIGAYTDIILDNEAFNKAVGNEIEQMMKKPEPRINIPGLNFSEMKDLQKVQDPSGQVYMYIPFLGEYITAVYKYAIAMAGVLAVIMLIFAGVEWIIYPEDHAKSSERIKKALIGLVMAVGSYAILYAVNPELVSFKNLRVAVVKFEPLPMMQWSMDNISNVTNLSTTNGEKFCGCAQYRSLYKTSQIKDAANITAKLQQLSGVLKHGPSPLADPKYGSLIAELAQKYQFDPMLAIAIWTFDSGLGTEGAGEVNQNPGNIICEGDKTGSTFTCNKTLPNFNYKFRRYNDWGDAIRDWFAVSDAKTGWKMWRETKSIKELMNKYCPLKDNPTLPKYIDYISNSLKSTNPALNDDINKGSCPC